MRKYFQTWIPRSNPPTENTGILGVRVKKIQADDSGDPK